MAILPAAALPLEDPIGAAVRAAQCGLLSELRHLLEVRAIEASDRDNEGCSLLHWAAINGRTDVVALLLAHDADPSAPGGLLNETPLQWAARQGHVDVMAQLLRTGMACTGHKNVEGRDALFLCVLQGNRRGLMLLAAHGAEVNSSDSEGLSPLLFACKYRPQNLALIRTLLTLGADPSFQCDALGNSALHLVASQPPGQGLRDLVRTLRGADRRLCFRRNREGKDPVALAKDKGMARLASYLSRVRVVQRLPPVLVSAVPTVLLVTVMSGCNFHGVLGAAVALAFVLSLLLRYHPALTPRQQDWLGVGTTAMCVVCFSAFYLFRLQGRHGGSVLVDALFLSLACLSLYFLSTVRMAHASSSPMALASASCPSLPSPREALRCLLLDCKAKVPGAAAGADDVASDESLDFRRVCDGCFSIKGARSRHCVSCGRCVRGYDHHCSFLSCCIAEENHLDFMIFLLAATLAMALWLVLATQRLWSRSPDAHGTKRIEAVVLALGALTFVWLVAVTGLQLWLIGNEITMAEYFRQGDSQAGLRASALSFKKWVRNAVRFFISPPASSSSGRAAAAACSGRSASSTCSSHHRAAMWTEAAV